MSSSSRSQSHCSKSDPVINCGLDRGWDVTADGERFLFILSDSVAEGTETALQLILIQNWADELKRLAPREPR